MKNLFLHFDLGYSYYSGRLGAEPDLRSPAGHDLADASVRPSCGSRSGCRSGSSRRCGGARGLTARAWGRALVLVSAPEYWLGLIVLYLFAADIGRLKVFPGAGSYVGLDQRPLEMVHLAAPALARARRELRRDLRAADARQPDRDDGRGLHPHRAREGPERAPRGRCATACAPRSTRS